jgi:Tol biopolymer transport system component
MHPDGTEVTQLLSDNAIDKEPTFSPDGAMVAFTSDRKGAAQIFTLDLAAGAIKQLTNQPEGADQPSFSHDGKLVAFHSGASVYIVGVDGAGATLIGTGLDSFNAYMWPHFSRDDAELVFDRNNEINAINVQSHAFRRIVQNTTTIEKSPAVSPDGVDVAYQVFCDSGGPSIWTTPFSTLTDACKGRRVTPPGDTNDSQRPAWGTNGVLAYERIDKATNLGAIAIISRAAGSQPCVLTPAGSDNRNPAWSP